MKPTIVLLMAFVAYLTSVSAAAIEMGNPNSLQKRRDSNVQESRVVQVLQTRQPLEFYVLQNRLSRCLGSKSKPSKSFDDCEKEYKARYAKKSLVGTEKDFEKETVRLHDILALHPKKWDKKCVFKTVELVIMAEKWVTQREARGELFHPDHRKRLQEFVNYVDKLIPALHNSTQDFPSLPENAILADYLVQPLRLFRTELASHFKKLELDYIDKYENYAMNDLYMGMQTTWVSVERSTGSRSLRWQDTNHELLVQIRTWLHLEAAINDRRPGYERLGNLLSDRTIREEVNRTTHYIRGILAKGMENQILRHYFQDNLTWLEVFLPTREDRGIPPPMYSVAIEEGKPPAY